METGVADSYRWARSATCPKEVTQMQSIAAYYLIVANDLARDESARARRYDSIVPKRSILGRVADALTYLVRPARRAGSSAA